MLTIFEHSTWVNVTSHYWWLHVIVIHSFDRHSCLKQVSVLIKGHMETCSTVLYITPIYFANEIRMWEVQEVSRKKPKTTTNYAGTYMIKEGKGDFEGNCCIC